MSYKIGKLKLKLSFSKSKMLEIGLESKVDALQEIKIHEIY